MLNVTRTRPAVKTIYHEVYVYIYVLFSVLKEVAYFSKALTLPLLTLCCY
jgi:hypothetical protein